MKEKNSNVIDKEISLTEPCLRCLHSPLNYSNRKGKVLPNAVLPPPNRGRNDASLFRKNYLNKNWREVCEERGRSIKMGESILFTAIGELTRQDVMEINFECSDLPVEADIEYAPMHNGCYIDIDTDICVDDNKYDMPDHAELRYNCTYEYVEPIKTHLRVYATKLAKRLKVVHKVNFSLN